MGGNFKAPMTVDLEKSLQDYSAPVILTTKVGNITADATDQALALAPFQGRVREVVLAMGERGYDSNEELKMELDVKINGTSVFTTKPLIYQLSGETPMRATSFISGEGVTPGTINTDAAAFSRGDFLTYTLNITRGTPNVEMANAVIMVELEK